jgi:hypothetical protein
MQAAMLEYFPQLLAVAQQLVRATSANAQDAGLELYHLLFVRFTQPYNQQVHW